MKPILRATVEVMFWLWGLHILVFVAPGPVLWHYAALFAAGLVIAVVLPRKKRDTLATIPLGLIAMVYVGVWAWTWYHGWPDSLRWGLIYANMVLSPVMIVTNIVTAK